MAFGAAALWAILWGVLHEPATEAIAYRGDFRAKMSWVNLNRFFGLCLAAFLISVTIDYGYFYEIQILSPVFVAFGLLGFALALFETRDVTMLINDIDHVPTLIRTEIIMLPFLAVPEAISGYQIILFAYFTGQYGPTFDVAGWQYIALLLVGFVSGITIATKIRRDSNSGQPSFGSSDALSLLLFLSPWVFMLALTIMRPF